jgi:hypothetical protein
MSDGTSMFKYLQFAFRPTNPNNNKPNKEAYFYDMNPQRHFLIQNERIKMNGIKGKEKDSYMRQWYKNFDIEMGSTVESMFDVNFDLLKSESYKFRNMIRSIGSLMFWDSVDIDVDLSGQVCPFTQDEFQFGQVYYRVTIELPGPNNTLVTNVSYFSINDLQIWFCANQRDMRCRHPLYNVEFSLDDVRRFTYRRPPQGGQRKRRSKISNNKRIKRSKQQK